VKKRNANEQQGEETRAHRETRYDDDVHSTECRDLHRVVPRLARVQLTSASADEEQRIVDADAESDHRHCVLREHANWHDMGDCVQHGEREHRCAKRYEQR